ncbi:hypothetical protein [Laceyella sediminis]|jgi:hypothetical protein|uniref:hypothetical protein n=1 Tax=Laceyella sediminis TaxID=573074 RepID=UPI000D080064|nr:hypothetical protein [Laceyella sediminis]
MVLETLAYSSDTLLYPGKKMTRLKLVTLHMVKSNKYDYQRKLDQLDVLESPAGNLAIEWATTTPA